MAEIQPMRSANIQGVPASIILAPLHHGPTDDFRSVQSAADLDRERGNPADMNHCPLCNEYFGPEAFARHAQSCINANAPRWERQRDAAPPYVGQKRFGRRMVLGSTPMTTEVRS